MKTHFFTIISEDYKDIGTVCLRNWMARNNPAPEVIWTRGARWRAHLAKFDGIIHALSRGQAAFFFDSDTVATRRLPIEHLEQLKGVRCCQSVVGDYMKLQYEAVKKVVPGALGRFTYDTGVIYAAPDSLASWIEAREWFMQTVMGDEQNTYDQIIVNLVMKKYLLKLPRYWNAYPEASDGFPDDPYLVHALGGTAKQRRFAKRSHENRIAHKLYLMQEIEQKYSIA